MRKGSVEAHLEGECRYRIAGECQNGGVPENLLYLHKEELRALPLQVEVGPG